MGGWKGCDEVNVMSAIARKYAMYVIFGIRALAPQDDPYLGPKGYNTVVILGRRGEVVGYYRKMWPCCPGPDGTSMNDGYPSREGVKVFDLDFGRVGLQTCYDM